MIDDAIKCEDYSTWGWKQLCHYAAAPKYFTQKKIFSFKIKHNAKFTSYINYDITFIEAVFYHEKRRNIFNDKNNKKHKTPRNR